MTNETYTLTEAARDLGLSPVELLDFDQSLNGDWEHQFTRDEIETIREALAVQAAIDAESQ